MTRFNIEGQFLDLPADLSLQFVRKNILFAFDNIDVSRSTSFEIPATAKNNYILGIANDPALFGLYGRVRIEAQMQYSGGAENGYLYITSANRDSYSAVFVFGELLGLKDIKEAGKIADFMAFEDSVRIGTYSQHDADEANLPLFANVAYQNNHAHAPTPADHTSWDANYFPLPSIGLRELILQSLTELGVTLDDTETPELAGIRMTIAKPLRDGEGQTTNFAVTQNVVNTAALNRVYFSKTSVFLAYSRDGGRTQTTWNAAGFKVSGGRVKIKFDAGFDNGLFMIQETNDPRSIKFLGGYSVDADGTITGDPLAEKEVELENGTAFFFVTDEMVVRNSGDFGIMPPGGSYTYNGVAEVAFSGDEAQAGDTVYLQQNLPDLTLVELLKMAAAVTHSFLYYEQGVLSFVRDIDTTSPLVLDKIVSIEDITRTFGDYAQNNIIAFDDNPDVNPEPYGYFIYNENIPENKELLHVPYSRPLTVAAFTAEPNPYDALIKDLVWNSATSSHEYPNEYGTLFFCDANYYGEPVELVANDRLFSLCQAATSIKVEAIMPLFVFASLEEKRLINIRGQLYVWTEATWQGDVATLSLNKVILTV